MAQKPEAHEVYEDTASWGGYPRLTCTSCPTTRDVTCLRGPWMTDAEWREQIRQFRQRHPFTQAKRYEKG